MTPACREVEVLVSLRAGGADLPAPDAARLDRHLEQCAGCRAALEQGRELMDLVRLPPPEAAETLALADLPSRALAELRRRDRRRGMVRRVAAAAAGMAVAAGVALALLSPAWLRLGSPAAPDRTGEERPAVVAQASWQEPDMDALWRESDIVNYGSGSSTSSNITDAVLAAYDAGDGLD